MHQGLRSVDHSPNLGESSSKCDLSYSCSNSYTTCHSRSNSGRLLSVSFTSLIYLFNHSLLSILITKSKFKIVKCQADYHLVCSGIRFSLFSVVHLQNNLIASQFCNLDRRAVVDFSRCHFLYYFLLFLSPEFS
jgi:hypothetical protein